MPNVQDISQFSLSGQDREREVSKWYSMCCGIHQFFLSLTKHMARLLTCCTIQGIKDYPEGYTHDLATVTLSTGGMDQVHQIVSDYGRK